MAIELPADLVEFLESGVSIVVGSRNASMRPEAARGLGLHVAADHRSITLFLNAALADRMLADFADNGRIAVTVSRIIDHRSVQLKGTVRSTRPAIDGDLAAQQRYLAASSEQVSYAGLPRSVVRNVRLTPAIAIEFDVDELFVQTPGPGAGRRMVESNA